MPLGDLQPESTRSQTISDGEAEVLEASKEASREGSATAALKRFQDQKQAKLRMQVRACSPLGLRNVKKTTERYLERHHTMPSPWLCFASAWAPQSVHVTGLAGRFM